MDIYSSAKTSQGNFLVSVYTYMVVLIVIATQINPPIFKLPTMSHSISTQAHHLIRVTKK